MPTRQALDLALRYNRTISGLEASTIERLNAAMDRAYRDLERELRRTYPAIASNQSLFVTQRKVLILEQLGETLQLVRPDQAAFYQQTLQETLQTANELGRTLADELISATNPSQAVAALSNVNIEAAALQARDGADRLRRYSEEFRGRASAIVEQGLIQGWGPARVADLMRRELGTTKSKAETLARTEVLSALNDAAQQRYAENGLQYFQWIATPSEASCKYCISRNMQVFRLGTKIPSHPRCRCVAAPYDKRWQDLGLTDDAFAKEYRDRLIDDADKLGVKPDAGVTPFEKYAGLTKAPKPFWSPSREIDTNS